MLFWLVVYRFSAVFWVPVWLVVVDILSLKGVKRIKFTRIKVKVVTFIRIKLIWFAHFKLKLSTNTSPNGSQKLHQIDIPQVKITGFICKTTLFKSSILLIRINRFLFATKSLLCVNLSRFTQLQLIMSPNTSRYVAENSTKSIHLKS